MPVPAVMGSWWDIGFGWEGVGEEGEGEGVVVERVEVGREEWWYGGGGGRGCWGGGSGGRESDNLSQCVCVCVCGFVLFLNYQDCFDPILKSINFVK